MTVDLDVRGDVEAFVAALPQPARARFRPGWDEIRAIRHLTDHQADIPAVAGRVGFGITRTQPVNAAGVMRQRLLHAAGLNQEDQD